MQDTSLLKTLFRSLRHRNFRLFWSGQLVSLIGTWMQNVGQAWLVLELTHSSFKLGVVSALQFAPMLFLSFFAGAYIDYFSKRKIIIATQAVFMVLAFTLAVLDFTGAVQYWHIVALAALLGVVNTIDMPARQAFIIEMVGKEDLMNAIALNSSVFNAARAIGPAIAGMLIAAGGTAVCFLVNGLSFLAVLASLLRMKVDRGRPGEPKTHRVFQDIEEALRYIKTTPVLIITILLVAVVSIFAANFNVLVPVFARQELHRDAAGFGFLMSSFGFGALIGAVSLAALSRLGPKPAFLLGGGMSLSIMLILIGLQRTYGITAFLLALSGWCNGDLLRYGQHHGPVEYRRPAARQGDERVHLHLRRAHAFRQSVCRNSRPLAEGAPYFCTRRVDLRDRLFHRDPEALEDCGVEG